MGPLADNIQAADFLTIGTNMRDFIQEWIDSGEFKRRHDKTFFCKYTSAESAKVILESGKLKWDSPLNFNDAFDAQSGLHIDLDLTSLPQVAFERIKALVFQPETPVFENPNGFSESILFFRKMLPIHGFPEQNLRQMTELLMTEVAGELRKTRDVMAAQWHAILKSMRALCLTEDYDNDLMWALYASNHAGVVLKFRVMDTIEDDDPMWSARRIEYLSSPTPLVPADYLDDFFGIKDSATAFQTIEYAFKKHERWKHEKEWRIWTTVDEAFGEGPLYSKFNPKKLESIFFGCKCSKENMDNLMELALSKYPEVLFFKARRHEYDFNLAFDEVISRPERH